MKHNGTKGNGAGLEPLTDSQRKTLREIQQGIRNTGIPPTIREMAERLGIGATAVRFSLRILERKRYIRCLPMKARGIVLLHDAN